jgi:hypothetical protein
MVIEPPTDVAVEVKYEDVGTVVSSILNIVVEERNGAVEEIVRYVQAASALSDSRHDGRRRG